MKDLAQIQVRIQEIIAKMNSNPKLLNMNHNEGGNIENIISASKSLESGDFRTAIDEVQGVINELNNYAADLMNQIEHTSVTCRYPEEGPKKYEQER